ncbi:hypothetical protein MnTg02_02650 [bacterium MnTg02]|nr:hypothetical protein MnTg02_02650 [bacterium MnTg02]
MMYAVLKLDLKHTVSNPLDKVNVLAVRAENTVITDWRELTINDRYCYNGCKRPLFALAQLHRAYRQSSNSSILLILWSAMQPRTSVSQACGSTSLSLAVSISV